MEPPGGGDLGLAFLGDSEGSVLDGEGRLTVAGFAEAGVYVASEGTAIRGISSTGGRDGVLVIGAASVELSDIDASNNARYGVDCEDAPGLTVASVTARGNEGGVVLQNCDDSQLLFVQALENEFWGMVVVESADVEVRSSRSAENGTGILVLNATGRVLLEGNTFGADDDTSGNRATGVMVRDSPNVEIVDNLIAGHGSSGGADGVFLFASPHATLQANRIGGPTPAGAILGNSRHGVHVAAQSGGALIGGTRDLGLGNTIVGSLEHGVFIDSHDALAVQLLGNDIGLDAPAPTPAAPNAGWGVEIVSGIGDLGSLDLGYVNQIVANGLGGVHLASPERAHLQGTLIGVTEAGVLLGNDGPGVLADGGVARVLDVHLGPNARGIVVRSQEVLIRGASFTDVVGLPIDLELSGPTPGNGALAAPAIVASRVVAGMLQLEIETSGPGQAVQLYYQPADPTLWLPAGYVGQSDAGGLLTVTLPVGPEFDPAVAYTFAATGAVALPTSEFSEPFTPSDSPCTLAVAPVSICDGDSVTLQPELRCGGDCIDPPAPSVDCDASCTVSLAGGGNVNLNAGDVGCTHEGDTWTGTLNMNGGEYRVCGTARPANLNSNQGSLVVLGSASISHLNIGGSFSVLNYGHLQARSLNAQGDVENHGRLEVDTNLWLNGAMQFFNTGVVTVRQEMGGQADVVNHGVIEVAGRMQLQGELDNSCSLSAAQLHSPQSVRQNGFLTVSRDLRLQGDIVLEPGSRVDGASVTLGGDVLGLGPECSSVFASSRITGSSGTLEGPVDLCYGSYTDHGLGLGLEVTEDCSCELPSVHPAGLSWEWAPSAGLSSTVVAAPLASPTVSTTYQVRVSDASGMLATTTAEVDVMACP